MDKTYWGLVGNKGVYSTEGLGFAGNKGTNHLLHVEKMHFGPCLGIPPRGRQQLEVYLDPQRV